MDSSDKVPYAVLSTFVFVFLILFLVFLGLYILGKNELDSERVASPTGIPSKIELGDITVAITGIEEEESILFMDRFDHVPVITGNLTSTTTTAIVNFRHTSITSSVMHVTFPTYPKGSVADEVLITGQQHLSLYTQGDRQVVSTRDPAVNTNVKMKYFGGSAVTVGASAEVLDSAVYLPSNTQTLLAVAASATDMKLYESTDDSSFSLLNTFVGSNPTKLRMYRYGSSHLALVAFESSNLEVFLSEDDGQTFGAANTIANATVVFTGTIMNDGTLLLFYVDTSNDIQIVSVAEGASPVSRGTVSGVTGTPTLLDAKLIGDNVHLFYYVSPAVFTINSTDTTFSDPVEYYSTTESITAISCDTDANSNVVLFVTKSGGIFMVQGESVYLFSAGDPVVLQTCNNSLGTYVAALGSGGNITYSHKPWQVSVQFEAYE